MRGVHIHRLEVRFGDCDPAGIVYFPRFYDFFHDAMETWFPARLGLRYAELVVGRKIGFPAVHTEADFSAPCALGEAIVRTLARADRGRALGDAARAAVHARFAWPAVAARLLAAFEPLGAKRPGS